MCSQELGGQEGVGGSVSHPHVLPCDQASLRPDLMDSAFILAHTAARFLRSCAYVCLFHACVRVHVRSFPPSTLPLTPHPPHPRR